MSALRIVTFAHSQARLPCRGEQSAAPLDPPPHIFARLAVSRLIFPLPSLPPSSGSNLRRKDAWLRATAAQSALICCSASRAVKTRGDGNGTGDEGRSAVGGSGGGCVWWGGRGVLRRD